MTSTSPVQCLFFITQCHHLCYYIWIGPVWLETCRFFFFFFSGRHNAFLLFLHSWHSAPALQQIHPGGMPETMKVQWCFLWSTHAILDPLALVYVPGGSLQLSPVIRIPLQGITIAAQLPRQWPKGSPQFIRRDFYFAASQHGICILKQSCPALRPYHLMLCGNSQPMCQANISCRLAKTLRWASRTFGLIYARINALKYLQLTHLSLCMSRLCQSGEMKNDRRAIVSAKFVNCLTREYWAAPLSWLSLRDRSGDTHWYPADSHTIENLWMVSTVIASGCMRSTRIEQLQSCVQRDFSRIVVRLIEKTHSGQTINANSHLTGLINSTSSSECHNLYGWHHTHHFSNLSRFPLEECQAGILNGRLSPRVFDRYRTAQNITPASFYWALQRLRRPGTTVF